MAAFIAIAPAALARLRRGRPLSEPGGDAGSTGKPLPPTPSDRPRRNPFIVAVGVLVILGGSVIALPAGLCSGIMIPALGDSAPGDAVGVIAIALAVAAVGAGLIWFGCQMVLSGSAARIGFAAIVTILLLVIAALAAQLSTMKFTN